jgi:hypothetical protein
MTAGRHPHHDIDSKRPEPWEKIVGVDSDVYQDDVYHATAGVLYVVVDAIVMDFTTFLSTSTHLAESRMSDNVQFCSRRLKEPDGSGTLWYTHSSFSTKTSSAQMLVVTRVIWEDKLTCGCRGGSKD